ncbi:PAS domain-containing sensor histidine kinase [Phenylobacterium sp.]|uniref:hybrid sensor histidine kinase/response regulator n=1 Tax=Phenylobacterium sp. TaxID=1871053 RepID=UPI002721703C|nr:PAS domain-containing sensor histidine kinase [Phenylobacterium sp.]MDO8801542.1 PAS domain-containing protein [Phenylobacterium sp.]
MTPVEWPLRLIPQRAPAFLEALAVSAAAMAVAILARGALLGWGNAASLSATYFPAYIVASLYGGHRWGWATLAVSMILGLTNRLAFPIGVSEQGIYILFAASGAATVLVAGALRETLLRLAEARRAQDDTQAALDRSERRLRLAQDAGSVGLWDWDVVTGDGVWSPTLYRNLGLDPVRDANVRSLLDMVHPDDREKVRQVNIIAVKEGRMDPIEYRVIWPDGSVHWLLSRGEMLRDDDGRIVRAVGVNIDVTERRMAFEQVRESEARFRALADSAPVLLWVSKTDGQREFVNQAYVAFLGATYDEALHFDWRKRLHADDVARIMTEQVAGEASRQLFTLEARYSTTDGAWRWIRSFSQPRYGPEGDFIGFIGIAFDVTDAKQAQADLKHINDLLADTVQAALAERDEAEAALRHAQKLEAVGQLTGGVAHDFNNLLTVIIGALDLIQRHPADAERRERMIEAALGAARRGERLTGQLLAFSRRQALTPEAIVIDELLADAEPLLRRAVGEAVSLTVAPAAPGAVAMIDTTQFEAAVMNLVVNARDAVASGGSIRLETGVCELAEGEVAEIPAGPYVRVVVHDTGVGMDEATVARVFDPFFTTKEIGKGTGLGLSQVYGFARQSGGGVSIDSAPGKGASVRLYLPRSAVTPTAAEPEAAAVARGPALRILLVEDDTEVGDLVAMMLEDLNHQVFRADGAQAFARFMETGQPFDLLITDLIMPGAKTGVDLAHEAVKARPGLPVILSSGYTGEALASADGAPWPLLRKPYAADDLAQAILDVMASPAPVATSG